MSKLSRLEKVVFFLSFYVIIELYLSSIIRYPHSVKIWMGRIDFAICLIFLYDFFKRLFGTKDKWIFLRGNWIDFVSSIPTVGFLRIGRVARIFRVLRILRSGRAIYRFINKDNSLSTFGYIVILNIILILLSSVSLYHLERHVNPEINTLGDSVWWCIITTTTLGFVKDIQPVTVEGKVFSVLLIGVGMILFGTFTAMMTDYFVGDEDIRRDLKNVHDQLERIEHKIDRLLDQ